MKFSVFLLSLVLMANAIQAQKISSSDYSLLQQKEDSMQSPAMQIIQGRNTSDRFYADSNFTRILIRALKTP
ncbi:MAG: hypothetical protein JSU03_00220, partial [Bacteroidetes bacterium]|nr:hypothetical protein [Bacteroidota bacterium]